MSGHEFENKVQTQMEELKIVPSDALWNKVEMQLQKDRRKRRVFIWLPLLLLIGIGGIWGLTIMNTDGTDKSGIAFQTIDKQKNTPVITNNETSPSIVKDKENVTNTSENKKDFTSENDKKNNNAKRDITREIKKSTDETKESPQITKWRETGKQLSEEKKIVSRKKNGNIGDKIALAEAPASINQKNQSASTSAADENSPYDDKNWKATAILKRNQLIETVKSPLAIDPASFKPLVVEISPVVVSHPVEKSIPVKNKTNSISSRWQWGLAASLGVSRIAEGNFLSGLGTARVVDANYSNSGSVSNLPPGGGGFFQPAAIQPGPAWQVGLFVKRKLSPKTNISSGLQWGLYNTRSAIGIEVDSQKTISNNSSQSIRVDNYYTVGSSTRYNNSYQFIEIPLDLHFRLNGRSQIPLYWVVGISYSTLLRSSALHYDGASGVYYKDDNLFRKAQFSWKTGLAVEVFSKSKHPLQLGPQFYYNTSRLLDNSSSSNTHLWGGGLQVRWIFKK